MPTQKGTFILVLGGITAGLFLTFYTAGLFVLFLFFFSLFLIKITVKTESSDFLIKLFIISFILRALLCVVNYNVGLERPFWGGDTQPDATVYSGNAFYIAHLLKEDAIEKNFAMAKDPYLARRVEIERDYYKNKLPAVDEYQFGKYVFSLGIFYAWLGYAPIAVKMINSIFGCISIVIVYLIARQLLEEEKPARIAAVIFAFFPSIFYWSVTALRDSLCNLLILAYLLCLIKAITKRSMKFIFWSVFFAYLYNLFRPRMLMGVLAGIALVLISFLIKILKSRRPTALRILLFFTACFILCFSFSYKAIIVPKIVNVANLLARSGISSIKRGGIYHLSPTDYKIYSDLAYEQGKLTSNDVFSFGYLAGIIKGIVYFFFAPFPLGNWSLNFVPFYPQVIYWYFMFPFAIKGWLIFLKKNTAVALNLTALFLLLVVPLVLSESNIGTAFRHKDMFIPIAFIFAAYAFTRRKAV